MEIFTLSQLRVAVIMCFAHMCHHLCTVTIFPMLPLIRDGLGLNYFQAGLLVSSFSIFYGFGQVPMAILADRLNRSKILIAGLIGTSLSTLGVGITWEYWQMLLCFSSLGLLGATYHALATSFISDNVPANLRGRSLGIHIIGGSAGYLVAPILAVAVVHWAGNWRWAFMVMPAPALLCAMLLWLDPFNIRIRQRGGFNIQSAQRESYEDHRQTQAPGERPQTVSYLGIVKKIGILAGLSMMMQMVNASVMSFLPLYFVDHHGISSKSAGLMVAILFGAGIIGAPGGGALSDRIGRKAVILLSLAFSGPLLLGITWASAGTGLIAFILTYGMVTVARAPAMESLIVDTTPSHRRTTFLGFYYLVSQETAGVLTPLVGYLIDYQGAGFAFTGLGAALSIMGMLAFAYRNRI